MDTSLTWLYESEEQYRLRTGQSLWSASDWHNDPGDIVLPTSMLGALKVDPSAISRYRFLDTARDLKKQISCFYQEHCEINLRETDFAFCQNGTSALNLLAKCLAELGVTRMLVLTPAYFSLFDVLKLYGITVIYLHANLLQNLSFCLDHITTIIRDQMAEAIFVTNPIFGTGKRLSLDFIASLAEYTGHTRTWLILDDTLGGLPWVPDTHSPFANSLMREATKHQRFVYIWSVSKSLFLNGLKHSLVLAPNEIVSKMEKSADSIVGGLTIHQISLAEQIYCDANTEEIMQCSRDNISRFVAAYDLCATCLRGTSLQLSSAEAGFHAIAFVAAPNINPRSLARRVAITMIAKQGISFIPLEHFGFPPFSPVGFRINLSKNPGRLCSALTMLMQVIHEDPDLTN